jgi:hypothetical protein
MYRDYSIWVAEFLFSVTNGVPIMSSVFLLLTYSIMLTIVCAFPVFMALETHRFKKWMPLVFIVSIYTVLFIGMGPVFSQLNMTTECKPMTVMIETENVQSQELTYRECRSKDNYYGEFGEWRVIK